MPRLLPLAAGLLALTAAANGPPPAGIAPKTVALRQPGGTLAEAIAQVRTQTGIAVDGPPGADTTPCRVALDRVPFWQALDQIADRTDTRIALRDRGRTIALVKRSAPPTPASVDGPFRVAVSKVESRYDFDTGSAVTDITLDVHWEPRFPVFRLDAQPTVTTVADDRGGRITAHTAKGKATPRGFLHATTVRLTGVPRAASRLTHLAGTFTVTAAERMLPFVFDDLTAAATKEREGVSVALHPPRAIDGLWEFRLDLTYPPTDIEFESFESWVTENRLRLTGPNGQTVTPTDYDIPEQGRRVVAVYRFPTTAVPDPKGWTATYETPSPLVEFPVRFDLKDIPLP